MHICIYTQTYIQKEKETKTGSQLNHINSVVLIFQTNAITTLKWNRRRDRKGGKEGGREERRKERGN